MGARSLVKLSRQKGAVQRCLGDSPVPWRQECPEVGPVTKVEGAEDADDAERRGVEDGPENADGAAGVGDVGGVADVDDIGRGFVGGGRP